jgi:hypothetical protein
MPRLKLATVKEWPEAAELDAVALDVVRARRRVVAVRGRSGGWCCGAFSCCDDCRWCCGAFSCCDDCRWCCRSLSRSQSLSLAARRRGELSMLGSLGNAETGGPADGDWETGVCACPAGLPDLLVRVGVVGGAALLLAACCVGCAGRMPGDPSI